MRFNYFQLINTTYPINHNTILNNGLVANYFPNPSYMYSGFGGVVVRNIMSYGRFGAILTNMTPSSAHSTQSHVNGAGSLLFDGSDDYLVVSKSFLTKNSGAISVWFKGGTQTSATGSSLRPIVIDPDSGALGTAIHLSMVRNGLGTHGYIQGRIGDGDAVNSDVAYNDNEWHNAILSWDGSTVYLYIDGVKQTDTGTVTTASTSYGYTYIGGQSTTHGIFDRFFTGYITDIRIYDKYLTENIAKELYKQTSTDYKLLYNWFFDYFNSSITTVEEATFTDGGVIDIINDNSLAFINWCDPINYNNKLNIDLAAWWITIPNANKWGSSTLVDITRYKNNATLTNIDASNWGNYSPFMGYGTLNFNGSDEYGLTSSTHPSLDFGTTTKYTISTYIKVDTLSANMAILSSWNLDIAAGINITIRSTGQISFVMHDGTAGNFATWLTTDTISINTWYHLVVVVNNRTTPSLASDVSIYINGKEATISLDIGTIGSNTNVDSSGPFYICAANTTSVIGRFFDGQIQDLRINRYNFNKSEVIQYYNLLKNNYGDLLNRIPLAYFNVGNYQEIIAQILLLKRSIFSNSTLIQAYI